MTILFASGEDTGFTAVGTTSTTTSSTFYRSSYSRCAIHATNAAAADPPPHYFLSPAFTSVSTLWLHAQIYALKTTNILNEQGLFFKSPDGVTRLVVRETSTAGQLKFSSRNAAGTLVDLGTFSSLIPDSVITQLDIKIGYGASGSIDVWFNSVSAFSFSGDNTTNSATQLNQFALGTLQNTGTMYWSEIIAADEDTRGMALWTLTPQAAGNTQNWNPSTVGNITDTTINDSTLISTSNNNDLSQWTTPTSAPPSQWSVRAIIQEARVRVGVTGPQHFDWSVRTGSADFTAGVSNAPTTSFTNFSNQIWAQNPNTVANWAITDIASGFNLGIKSLA